VRRFILALACLLLFPLAAAGCDDDDDGNDAVPSPPVGATATAPATTATPSTAPAITIDEPLEGGDVTAPIQMSGTANVFEAVLHIDALGNAAGTVLCSRRVMATSGTGTPGDWSGVLAFAPPETAAPITLRAYSFSPRDGAMEHLVERSVTLQPQRPNIVITSPKCAEEVSGAMMTVEGMAQVFEAALVVDLRDEFGTVIDQQFVMAASGVEFSPWNATFDVSALAPGFYDVVAWSESPQDGRVINVFPVQITLAP